LAHNRARIGPGDLLGEGRKVTEKARTGRAVSHSRVALNPSITLPQIDQLLRDRSAEFSPSPDQTLGAGVLNAVQN